MLEMALDRRTALATLGATGLLAATGCASATPSPSVPFVRRSGTAFLRGGKPYRYAGANAWYLAYLGADAPFGDRARLKRELDRLQGIGVRNLRILGGAEESPLKASIKPGFIDRDGHINEQLLVGLDYAMAELAKRGMTAVIYLTNNWEWSGGMMARLWSVTGKYLDANDPAHPWPAFPDAASAFYANREATGRFFAYARALVTRTNTVTGVRYADDPALMAWQLCNEPRPGVSPEIVERVLPSYYKWIDETAALIRALDPNHLVSLGMEGTIGTGGRIDIVERAHRNIDYLTIHIWPLNWGWVDGANLAGTADEGAARVQDYIRTHADLAARLGKPLVIDEFGYPRDGELYDPFASTTFRQSYYELIYSAAEASLASGGPIQGTNFWAWNGEARAQHADHRFRDGDTAYMGDPPHEPQGWYGNFDTDTAIMDIIRAHSARFTVSA
jgi:mannan endo-1,4-beta-mannosidase